MKDAHALFPKVGRIDYTTYWHERGFQISSKLKERESVMLAVIPAGSRIFDIGCGNSRLPVELKRKGCDVTVGDISPVVLDGFRAEGIPAVVLDLDSVSRSRVEGIYEYVIMSEVLEHMGNPEEIIDVLSRHTKRFVLTVPNSGFYPFRFRLFFGGRFLKQWFYHPSEHLRFWSHRDFLDWLSAQGLVVEKAIPASGLSVKGTMPWLKDIWPNLLAHHVVCVCRTNLA